VECIILGVSVVAFLEGSPEDLWHRILQKRLSATPHPKHPTGQAVIQPLFHRDINLDGEGLLKLGLH
jgi:hypothetical protein